ncbi:MAG TPA: DUF1015 family protein [Pseudohongiella sp.]|nr:DUF1015 family protein [Pseudohongiella sp.]
MKLNPVISPPSRSASASDHFVVCTRYLAGSLVTGILADVQLQFPADADEATADLPVLVYRCSPALETLLAEIVSMPPDDRQIDSEHGAEYQFWLVRDPELASSLQSALDDVDAFYWTDGWTESLDQPVSYTDHESFSAALLLSEDQLQPRARHRLLADLGGMEAEEFLQRLQKCFNIRVAANAEDAVPQQSREMGLYVDGAWYKLRLIEGTWFSEDPVRDMDISILAENIFELTLGIGQPETNARIAVADPVMSPQQLAELVDQDEWQAVFVLYPPSVELLMDLSDAGRLPPPHSVEFGQPLPWMTP